jgi:hypothetical protein
MGIGDPGDYSMILPTIGLADLEEEAVRLAQTLEADGTPAQASLVRQALIRLLKELEDIARSTSALAEQSIKEHELSSRVRPQAGTSSLNHYIGVSHPLPTVEGSVGINYEPDLYANVPWWWTNEEGYSGNLGRRFFGVFNPGGAKPNPAEFRSHPLLFIGKVKGSGKGTIRNPIPARRFVEDGAAVAATQWHAQIRAAKARFMAEVGRAHIQAQQIRAQRRGALPKGQRRRP